MRGLHEPGETISHIQNTVSFQNHYVKIVQYFSLDTWGKQKQMKLEILSAQLSP